MDKHDTLANYVEEIKKDREKHPDRYSRDLLNAAKDGNIELVRSLLKSGVNVDQTDGYAVTSLMISCHMGNYDMADLLLQYGADPNAIDCADIEFGFTGMPPALWASEKDIIELLVDHGADITIQSKIDDLSVLHKAVESQDKVLVEFCISKGANVNAILKNGESPLMTAIKTGNFKVFDTLLKNGADVNQLDNIGISPLNLARAFEQSEIASLLTESGANIDYNIEEKLIYWHLNDDDSTSVLFSYTDFEMEDGIRHVLACGICDNLCDDPCFGCTTFHFRIKDNNILDYCVGTDFRWSSYFLLDNGKKIGIYDSCSNVEQIKKRYPKMYESMNIRDFWEFEGWDFIPANIDQNKLYSTQNKLSKFFSKYYSFSNDLIEIDGLPISFPILDVHFEKSFYEFTDFYSSCHSSNVDHELLDIFSDTIFYYLGL